LPNSSQNLNGEEIRRHPWKYVTGRSRSG
jgi:hypothetical protein